MPNNQNENPNPQSDLDLFRGTHDPAALVGLPTPKTYVEVERGDEEIERAAVGAEVEEQFAPIHDLVNVIEPDGQLVERDDEA